MNDIQKKNKKLIMVCLVFMLVILFTNLTYALYVIYIPGQTNIDVSVSDLGIVYNKGVDITGDIPVALDKSGAASFDIELWKTSNVDVYGNIYVNLSSLSSELTGNDVIKWEIWSNGKKLTSSSFKCASLNTDLSLYQNFLLQNTKQIFTIYIWADFNLVDASTMSNASLTGSIKAEASQAKFNRDTLACLDNSGANSPQLIDGMIPVMYDQNKDIWVKADEDNFDPTYEWYDYLNQKWANAVMVSTETRNRYGTEAVGTEVKESDILAYYVWIPRYKYVLFNANASSVSPQEIEIEFESVSASKSTGTQNGQFLTHPAFTFGTKELSGIWVGKFETTGTGDTPTIKPNLQSLRNQNVSTQFETAQKMNSTTYVSSTGVSQMDAHMMKNTEWGAVAYLSHSKYGMTNEVCMNNSSSYYTGRSGGNVGGSIEKVSSHYPGSGSTSTNEYFTYGYYTYNDFSVGYDGSISTVKNNTVGKGTCASTTGNVYGIYDMSGGAWEYVMGVLADPEGNPRSGRDSSYNSGYNGMLYKDNTYVIDGKEWPEAKYYNLYTDTSYTNRILGDATGEVRSWYKDTAGFVSASYPWFVRGGRHDGGTGAGLFNFDGSRGDSSSNVSFRVAVAPVS